MSLYITNEELKTLKSIRDNNLLLASDFNNLNALILKRDWEVQPRDKSAKPIMEAIRYIVEATSNDLTTNNIEYRLRMMNKRKTPYTIRRHLKILVSEGILRDTGRKINNIWKVYELVKNN